MLVKSLKDNGKVELFTWFFTSILKLGPWIGKVSLIDSIGKVCSTEKYLGSSILVTIHKGELIINSSGRGDDSLTKILGFSTSSPSFMLTPVTYFPSPKFKRNSKK